MMDHKKKTLKKCNEACRKEWYCHLNYAVNEETVLCRGYYVDFVYASRYMVGIF
jgi:hypothetical protein